MKFKVTYLNYRLSNLFGILVFVIVWAISGELSVINNDFFRLLCNVVITLTVVLIYNRISNVIFRRTGYIIFSGTKLTIIFNKRAYDIKINNISEVLMSYSSPLGFQFLGKYIELVIKAYEHKKIKIISERVFNNDKLDEQSLSKVFFYIKKISPILSFEESFGGTFFTLKNKIEK